MRPENPCLRPKRTVHVSSLCCYLFYVLALASVGWWATLNSQNVEFSPINGTFQTHNPLMRLDRSEVPFRDFVAYLGAGPTYTVKMFRLGRSVAETMLGSRVACGWAFLLIWASVCRALKIWGPLHGLLALLWAFSFVTRVNIPFENLSWFHGCLAKLFFCGDSLLPLRVVLPALIIILLNCGTRFLSLGQKKTSWQWGALFGCLAGLGVSWSNDYGLPSLAAGLFCVLLAALGFGFETKSTSPKRWDVKLILAFALSSALSAVIGVVTVTWGSPRSWFDYNFYGAAKDQFFYFEGLWTVSWAYYVEKAKLEIVLFLVVFVELLRRYIVNKKSSNPFDIEAIFLLISAFLAANLTSIGGHVEDRYFSFFYLFCLSWLISIFQRCLKLALPIDWVAAKLAKVSEWRLNPRLVFFAGACGLVMCSLITLVPMTPFSIHRVSPAWLDVKEMGGKVSPAFQRSVAWGRRFREELKDLPRGDRIFSTYASSIELLAEAEHPSRSDYIIHALGPKERLSYLEHFDRAQTPFATTIRHRANSWERWIRAANWAFYARLVRSYVPYAKTENHMLWKKAPGGMVESSFSPTCTIEKQWAGNALLKVSLGKRKKLDRGLQAADSTRLVEVSLAYRVSHGDPLSILQGPRHKLIRVSSEMFKGETVVAQASDTLPGGVNISAEKEEGMVPVTVVEGGHTVVSLVTLPHKSAQLLVSSCEAVDIGPHSALEDFAATELTPYVSNFEKHNCGVLNEHGRTGFTVLPEEAVFFVGREVTAQFNGSGKRRVVEVEGTNIWVDGPDLDAVQDGYPHFIKLDYK